MMHLSNLAGVRVELKTPLPFDTVTHRLNGALGPPTSQTMRPGDWRATLPGADFTLFEVIDYGRWLSALNIRRRCLRFIIDNRAIAAPLLRMDLTSCLFAPVELLVLDREDAAGACVLYMRPSSLIVSDPAPAALRIAAEALDAKLDALAKHATSTDDFSA